MVFWSGHVFCIGALIYQLLATWACMPWADISASGTGTRPPTHLYLYDLLSLCRLWNNLQSGSGNVEKHSCVGSGCLIDRHLSKHLMTHLSHDWCSYWLADRQHLFQWRHFDRCIINCLDSCLQRVPTCQSNSDTGKFLLGNTQYILWMTNPDMDFFPSSEEGKI